MPHDLFTATPFKEDQNKLLEVTMHLTTEVFVLAFLVHLGLGVCSYCSKTESLCFFDGVQ